MGKDQKNALQIPNEVNTQNHTSPTYGDLIPRGQVGKAAGLSQAIQRQTARKAPSAANRQLYATQLLKVGIEESELPKQSYLVCQNVFIYFFFHFGYFYTN